MEEWGLDGGGIFARWVVCKFQLRPDIPDRFGHSSAQFLSKEWQNFWGERDKVLTEVGS